VPLETWVTFALAAEILLLIPGPTILLVVAYALAHGRTATVPLVVGVGLGDLTAMVFSFIGLGVLLQTLATLFVFLKWAGAAYLVYLGIQLWRTQPKPLEFSEIATVDSTRKCNSPCLSVCLHCVIPQPAPPHPSLGQR